MEALQPLVTLISVFHHVWLIACVGIGVFAALKFEGLIFAVIFSVILMFFSGFSAGVSDYIVALIFGFIGCHIVKFVKNKVLEIIPTKMSKPTIKMKPEKKHAKKISSKKQGNKNLHNKNKKK